MNEYNLFHRAVVLNQALLSLLGEVAAAVASDAQSAKLVSELYTHVENTASTIRMVAALGDSVAAVAAQQAQEVSNGQPE